MSEFETFTFEVTVELATPIDAGDLDTLTADVTRHLEANGALAAWISRDLHGED
jgi:hypothetical protein